MKPLPPEEDARRREAYESTGSDSAAAKLLGIHQWTFSQWRNCRMLPSKHRPAMQRGTSRHLTSGQAKFIAARLEHGLAQLRDRLHGDPFAILVIEGMMFDVQALAAAVGKQPVGNGDGGGDG